MKNLILSLVLMAGLMQNGISQTATSSFTQIPCNNNGIFTVNVVGLPLPITYTYSTATMEIIHSGINSLTDELTNISMNSSSGVYCTITGSNGVSIATYGGYTPSFEFSIATVPVVCPATNGTLTAVQAGGTPGPFTFLWTNEQSSQTFVGNGISVPVGTYSAQITDQVTGCVLNTQDSLAVYFLTNINLITSTTDANCSNGTANVNASGGTAPYTYLWSNGATTQNITGLGQGSYEVTATDALGCPSNSGYAFVEQNPQIAVNTSVTNSSCIEPNGSIIAFASGGASPYTYNWSNGQAGNTANALLGGIYYQVIAIDANGCSGNASTLVGINSPVTATYSTTSSLCTAATGSATLAISGGTAPYTIVWNNNSSSNTLTLTNLNIGTYSFQVTDALGCLRSGSVQVPSFSYLDSYATVLNATCPNLDGSVSINVYGDNPPFAYLWNNGATTNSIAGLAAGSYTCLITDAVGCTKSSYGYVSSNSPVNLNLSSTPVSCLFATDGTASSNVAGGTAPYVYSWSNGSSIADLTGLASGNYSLTVSDANGCSKSSWVSVTNANINTDCYCTISGKVYNDISSNCTFDGLDAGIENRRIHCSGFGYVFTDVNGNYSFQVPTGTYTITETISPYYPLAACQNNGVSASVVAAAGCTNTVNFANNVIVNHDLHIFTISSTLPPIPGNIYNQKIIVKNEGTVAETNAQLGYRHDGQLPFNSATLGSFANQNAVDHPNWYSVVAGFPVLNTGNSTVINLSYATPTNIPLGSLVKFYDTITSAAPIATDWLLDGTPWNNVNSYETTVIGSYDPNYKEVTPKGNGANGYVASTTKAFDYTIHFQNEGTYFAQNISVTDQLDADLDWTSLLPGYSPYPFTTNVSETGLVTFKFADINLAWKSSYGDALSSSFISYGIKRKTTNPQGTIFTNQANIFFDYNAPITTNTTTNTLNDALAETMQVVGFENIGNAVSVDLFPIPAKDVINIRVNNLNKNETATLSIIDLMGNIVQSNKVELTEGTSVITQKISALATGTYLARIQFQDDSFIVKKIVLSQE